MSTPARFPWGWGVGAAVIMLCAVLAATLVKPGGTDHAAAGDAASATASGAEIDMNISSCGGAWRADASGTASFTFVNGNIADVEVQLQEQASKKVYLEVDGIGPGARHESSVVLGAGEYRLVCYPAEADPVLGAPVKVSAPPAGTVLTAGVVPLTTNDLIPVAKKYGSWVRSRLPQLRSQLAALDAAVAAGDLTAARHDWLVAHRTYETLGAAYGAFGEYDVHINGPPASGKTALTDPDLTGFHKVEALLWSGAPAADIHTYTQRLVADVDALAKSNTLDRIDPLQIGLRAHEIVENAIQFELTGDADAGSHTNLATIDANLSGSRQALSFLAPQLTARYAALPQTEQALDAAQKLVESYHHGADAWTPLDSLTRAQRQQLDASLDAAVELLAPVAEISEPRKAVS